MKTKDKIICIKAINEFVIKLRNAYKKSSDLELKITYQQLTREMKKRKLLAKENAIDNNINKEN